MSRGHGERTAGTGAGSPGPAPSATAELWEHRDRRIPAVVAARALTGKPLRLVEDAARISFALSPEYTDLLEGMSQRVRSLPSVLAGEPERMVHSVRGPVLWSETMTARANSFGGEDVYVCRTVRRDHDSAPNRLLVWMLDRAVTAARLLRRTDNRSGIEKLVDAGTLRRVEEVGAASRSWRSTPRLAVLPAGLPNRFESTRMRHTRRDDAGTEVLLAAQRRAMQPFSGRDVAALTDPGAALQHRALLAAFGREAGEAFVFSCRGTTIGCAGIRWSHPANAALGQPADS